jgi:hypothetical protein
MQPESILHLLRRPATDPAVEQALDQFKIRRRPQVEVDEDDADGPVVQKQDWLKNRNAGIEFGFEDQATFTGDKTLTPGKGPMLLTQVYFYGDHPEVKPYVDRLPFGLVVGDDRPTVRARLAPFESVRRSWIRDTWELSECRLTVSYAEGGARVGFLLCALPLPPSPDRDDVVPVPALENLLSMLGRPMDDSQLRKVVKPLRVDKYLQNRGTTVIALMREEYGLELHFGGVRTMDASAFTNLLLYRDRQADARGWTGRLPQGLTFDDSPEVVFKKMGRPADVASEADFDGYALWHFREYSLQVHYSTMDNWILNLRILAPGVWDSY